MTRSLAARITRLPRVFDADRAADAKPAAAGLPAPLADLAVNAASAAPHLRSLLDKETDWLAQADADPDAALAALNAGMDSIEAAELVPWLRQTKRRAGLLIALADLGGVWTLEEVTGALSALADAACTAALRAALAPLLSRGKVPGMTLDDLDTAAGMCVLAMGKHGAGELNYSSDIDLICLFDSTRFDRADVPAARQAFVQATRMMAATLSDITADGYVFRTDLRLRPDPSVTPVCLSMEAAERYYESVGRTWERAAYIKARPAAGDPAAGARFIETLGPFVWRRHLDFAAIQDAHDMRLAIRSHKGLFGPITLPGHDMKLGRGGIREIEFYAQTRQLIAGGRDSTLRARGTCAALAALAKADWIEAPTANALQSHYVFHRTVEHRLQMMRDAQTHALPKSPPEMARLAAMMDMDMPALESALTERLSAVHALTEPFFETTSSSAAAPATDEPELDADIVESWRHLPALRSPRAMALFERLKPDLLARLAQAGKSDEALRAFDRFLAGLPAGVQLFSLLKSNPKLAELLIDIVGVSPALGQYLSRNAGVLDAVIDGDFFRDWPGPTALTDALAARLAAETDYEDQLDAARAWAKEWHFRIGVHHLRGLTDAVAAGAQYADLAEAVLRALWPVVIAEFARKHGPPPGRGAVILGMGALGAGRLSAESDLDLLVIYDAQGMETSQGARPLPSRTYYARLTQAMITAMSAPMAQGRLYDIDMRLRPSGKQGPVATSLASFDSYQRNEAWVWEHLALSRARVVAGPLDLAAEVEALCDAVIAQPRALDHIRAEVAEMRRRIAAAKGEADPWDAKLGPGHLQDIELAAQAGALMQGQRARTLEAGLRGGQAAGLFSPADVDALQSAGAFCWRLQCASRLLSAEPIRQDTLGQAGAAFLARALGHDSLDAAAQALALCTQAAAAIIDARFAPDTAP